MKRIIGLLLVAALLATSLGGIVLGAFDDTEDHWGKGAIDTWTGHGVINGDGDGGFRPEDPITRAETAKVVSTLLGLQALGLNDYDDLDDDWYTEDLLKVSAAGFMEGDGDGNIRPNDPITRQETAKLLAVALGIEPIDAEPGFDDDGELEDWAAGYVAALSGRGYIGGYGDGNFGPLDQINRASVVTLVDNAVAGYITEPGTYTDTYDGIVIVLAEDVTFSGAQIGDNLIISERVEAEGSVKLIDTQVDGAIIVPEGDSDLVSIDPEPENPNVPGEPEDPEDPLPPIRYTVTFDYGYDNNRDTKRVSPGATVTAPSDVREREGYVLIGWYLNGQRYDFSTPVTRSITLTAKWSIRAEVSLNPEDWKTDRMEPAAWTIDENGWIELETKTQADIDAEATWAWPSDTWYYYQGRGLFLEDPDLTDFWQIETELEITEEMITGDIPVLTSIWVQVDGVNAGARSDQINVKNWAIIRYAYDPDEGANWLYWDTTGAEGVWQTITEISPVEGVHTLTISYQADGSDQGVINLSIDGQAATEYPIDVDGEFGGITTPSYMIIQAYASDDPYTVRWQAPTVAYDEGEPYDGVFISDADELVAAIDHQQDGQSWYIAAGEYDLPWREYAVPNTVPGYADVYTHWFFPLYADNITVTGLGAPVITSTVGAGDVPVGNWNTQTLLFVFGDNVHLDGLTLQPRTNGTKTLEAVGNGLTFTLENCTFIQTEDDYAGGIVLNGDSDNFVKNHGDLLIRNNTIDGANIIFTCFDAGKNGSILIEGNTWTSIGNYAVGNYTWGGDVTKSLSPVELRGNAFNTGGKPVIRALMNQTFTVYDDNLVDGTPVGRMTDFSDYLLFQIEGNTFDPCTANIVEVYLAGGMRTYTQD